MDRIHNTTKLHILNYLFDVSVNQNFLRVIHTAENKIMLSKKIIFNMSSVYETCMNAKNYKLLPFGVTNIDGSIC